MSSQSEAREFANATERLARLAKELALCRKAGPQSEYGKQFREVDAARERCERARNALGTLKVTKHTAKQPGTD